MTTVELLVIAVVPLTALGILGALVLRARYAAD